MHSSACLLSSCDEGIIEKLVKNDLTTLGCPVRIFKCVSLSSRETKPEGDRGFLWLVMVLDEFRRIRMRVLCADSKAAQSLCGGSERIRGWNREQACVHQAGAHGRNMWITSRGHSLSTESLLSAQCRYECALNANSPASQPPVNLSAVCRQQMIADNRFAKGSRSHRAQAV